MTKHAPRLAFAGIFALLLATGAPQVVAQTPAAPTAPSGQAQQHFNDQQLEKFAGALGDVMKIREEFMAKLEKTGDASEARELQEQANEKMMGAVKKNGISLEDYNAISEGIQNDPELRNRVTAMMQ